MVEKCDMNAGNRIDSEQTGECVKRQIAERELHRYGVRTFRRRIETKRRTDIKTGDDMRELNCRTAPLHGCAFGKLQEEIRRCARARPATGAKNEWANSVGSSGEQSAS